MEAKLRTNLYKLELHWIKVIPIVIAVLSFLDTILSYLGYEGNTISYIIALLVWLFLYLSSFVFKFCRWHRMFLYYILVEGVINWYDYEFVIPLSLRPMIAIQLCLAVIFIAIGLYLHKHDKLPCKEDCCESHS
jgi:hypothetical protein